MKVFRVNKSHLTLVPNDLLDVISHVELKAGISVDISEITDEIKAEFPAMAKAEAILDIDPDRNKISIWLSATKVAPHVIGHEIIHLRRNIVEACPKMFPAKNSPPEMIQEILFMENDLEHFFVIREEISAFPDAKESWISHYKSQLRRGDLSEKSVIMHWCLLRTLFLEHNEELVKDCAMRLQSFNNQVLLKFSNSLQIELSQAFPDKNKMIEIHLEFFPDISQHVVIGQYVARNGTLSAEPLNIS